MERRLELKRDGELGPRAFEEHRDGWESDTDKGERRFFTWTNRGGSGPGEAAAEEEEEQEQEQEQEQEEEQEREEQEEEQEEANTTEPSRSNNNRFQQHKLCHTPLDAPLSRFPSPGSGYRFRRLSIMSLKYTIKRRPVGGP
jgi:hypothetical protein